MNNEDLNTDEIVIVGSRYGDLADVVTPFYEKGTPIEPEDIRKTLGCDEAVLMAVPNKHDAYAVGVFTLEEKRIGHVWMSQAPAVCRWLEQSKRDYVSVRIKRINTCITGTVPLIHDMYTGNPNINVTIENHYHGEIENLTINEHQ